MDNNISYIAVRLFAMNNGNVAFIYEKKFQKWLFKNSHEKQWNQPEEFNSLKFNNKGKIINAQFSKRTKNGIELTEKQFIEHELYQLSELDYNTLKTEDKKATYNFYQKFLESKLIEPIDNTNDVEYRQDIFASEFAFNVFENLHERFKDSPSQMANYSSIYRLMVKESLIRDSFKPSQFIDFISSEPYNVDNVDQLKTLNRIGEKNVVRQNFNAIVEQTKAQKTTVV